MRSELFWGFLFAGIVIAWWMVKVREMRAKVREMGSAFPGYPGEEE